jgi:hypothetical protein
MRDLLTGLAAVGLMFLVPFLVWAIAVGAAQSAMDWCIACLRREGVRLWCPCACLPAAPHWAPLNHLLVTGKRIVARSGPVWYVELGMDEIAVVRHYPRHPAHGGECVIIHTRALDGSGLREAAVFDGWAPSLGGFSLLARRMAAAGLPVEWVPWEECRVLR